MRPRKPAGAARFHPVVVVAAAFFALLLQASLPVRFPVTRVFQFPLLITIYFSMMRQDRIFGIALGTGIGLLQDALSHAYLGMTGMSKALVGYLAASSSTKFEVDDNLTRGMLIAILVLIHNGFLAILRYGLLNYAFAFNPMQLAGRVLVNVALGLVVFRLLDRFRRSS
jgi:rod shape-determining protein MreD